MRNPVSLMGKCAFWVRSIPTCFASLAIAVRFGGVRLCRQIVLSLRPAWPTQNEIRGRSLIIGCVGSAAKKRSLSRLQQRTPGIFLGATVPTNGALLLWLDVSWSVVQTYQGPSVRDLLALCLVSSVGDGFVYVLAPVGSLLPQEEA